jgi:small subunit ribosomal protein S29e
MNTHIRKYGKDSRHCRVCSCNQGLIRKYNLEICRRCFREYANDIGFKKVSRAFTPYCAQLNRSLTPASRLLQYH